MPLVENHDIGRIRADLAHAKGKLAARMQGQHVYGAASGIPADVAAQAHDNNMRNLYAHIAKLETDLVQSMLGARLWAASDIIARMDAPPVAPPTPAPSASPVSVTREPTDADVRAALQKFLTLVPATATVQSLKELISQ